MYELAQESMRLAQKASSIKLRANLGEEISNDEFEDLVRVYTDFIEKIKTLPIDFDRERYVRTAIQISADAIVSASDPQRSIPSVVTRYHRQNAKKDLGLEQNSTT